MAVHSTASFRSDAVECAQSEMGVLSENFEDGKVSWDAVQLATHMRHFWAQNCLKFQLHPQPGSSFMSLINRTYTIMAQ